MFSVRLLPVLAPPPSSIRLPLAATLTAPLPVQGPPAERMPLVMLLVLLLVTPPLSVRVPTGASVPDERLTPPLTVPLPLSVALVHIDDLVNVHNAIEGQSEAPEMMLIPPAPESVALAGIVNVPLTTFAAPKTDRSLPAVRASGTVQRETGGVAASCPLPPTKAPG